MTGQLPTSPAASAKDPCASGSFGMRFNMTRFILMAFVAVLVVSASPRATAEEVFPFESKVLERQLSLLSQVQDVLAGIPLTANQLIEEHDFELDPILNFVKQSIGYEDYDGSLRGIAGTLTSGAGNSLDQSLLLARLIKDIGYDARIVAGKLGDESTASFFSESGSAGKLASIADTTDWKELLAELGEQLSASPKLATGNLAPPGWLKKVDDLAGKLNQNLPNIVEAATPEKIEKQYFAVQYRDSASGPWATVHPAFIRDDAEVSFTPTDYFAHSIPEELQHRVTFQVNLDRRTGENRETVPVTPLFSFPTALEESLSFTYGSVPEGMLGLEEWTADSVHNALMSSTSFIPQVNEGPVAGGLVFDMSGNTVPLDVAMSQYSALFTTVGDKLDSAANTLSQSTSNPDEPTEKLRQTERVWLEITLRDPGGDTRRFVRTLAEWTGNKEAFYRELAREVSITIETGHPSFVDFVRRYSQAQKNVIEALLRETGSEPTTDEATLADDGRFWAGLDGRLFFLFSDFLADQLTDQNRYRATPSIVARYRSIMYFDDDEHGFDIVTNERRSPKGIDPGAARLEGIRNGVVDTIVERALLSGGGGGIRTSAYDALVRDDTSINPELDGSYRDLQELARWQIDAVTGETVGRLHNNWGGVIAASVHPQACLLVMSTPLQEYVKKLTLALHKTWGAGQFRNIQTCSAMAMSIAMAATVGSVTNWGALAESCELVPNESIAILCQVTIRMIQVSTLAISTQPGQDVAKTVIRRFFVACTNTLRTGRLWLP